ncbi:MAG TPA: hypothetical protein VFT87_03390 [Candidatus Saccharimonadales bacterium]|nr:hypothetical protein [Candidatus Saccharimonadales bacterium]
MRIPKSFVQTINPQPLRFQTIALADYMKSALALGSEEPELLSWQKVSPGNTVVTYTAFTFGGWVFLPLNEQDEPCDSRLVISQLGWGIFKRSDMEPTVDLDKACIEFDAFHKELRACLNKPRS